MDANAKEDERGNVMVYGESERERVRVTYV